MSPPPETASATAAGPISTASRKASCAMFARSRMTANDLREAAIELFGRRGWVTDLAICLKVDRTTVYRWMQGVPIPGPVEAAVTCWLERLHETGKRPRLPGT